MSTQKKIIKKIKKKHNTKLKKVAKKKHGANQEITLRENKKPFEINQKSHINGEITSKGEEPPNNNVQTNENDDLVVTRLLAPFYKFHLSGSDNTKRKMSNIKKNTLTPKEKNFIICSCQRHSTRYSRLKCLAAEATKKKKIFLMNTNCKAIREALEERGWVEKIPPNRMDLSTVRSRKFKDNAELRSALEKLLLSNFVESSLPSFIWCATDSYELQTLIRNSPKIVYNKMNEAPLWATKEGLCLSAKQNHWHFIKNVAEVNTPRTHKSFDEGEKIDFIQDYKLTACTSLLKWVLSMVANDQPIFDESGKIPISTIVFAINRCKEYLLRKQNRDIDLSSHSFATNGQWNSFLKKYYIIIAKKDVFKPDKDCKLQLYMSYAKCMLKEIYKFRPQLSCEGCHNIWIIKPAHCSRGRGIRLASKLAVLQELLNKGKYVFQKYIEESMLIHETKFDIRQYYLVTSTYPLVIWMYKDCYLKFSSQKYNLHNYHESIHLTNNAVQKRYKNCTNRHPELPQQNMWNLATFKNYLAKIDKEDVWDTLIYPGMKKCIVGIMLSCQDSVPMWKDRFELYGCDFILDKHYKPWLIEINSGPDLNPTTKVTADICPAALKDLIKVIIDRPQNTKAPTGNFECIYRQTLTLPVYTRMGSDLVVEGYALPNSYFDKNGSDKHEIYTTDDACKERDILSKLKKCKLMYEIEKHAHPQFKSTYSEVQFSASSKSEDDVNEVVSAATGQTEELIDAISSDHSQGTSSKNVYDIKKVLSSASIKSDPSLKRLQDKNLNTTECKRTTSLEALRFEFSELDDGPYGKGSGLIHDIPIEQVDDPSSVAPTPSEHNANNVRIVKIEDKNTGSCELNINHKQNSLTSFNSKEAFKKLLSIHTDSNESFIIATKKIFSFLTQKENENIFESLKTKY